MFESESGLQDRVTVLLPFLLLVLYHVCTTLCFWFCLLFCCSVVGSLASAFLASAERWEMVCWCWFFVDGACVSQEDEGSSLKPDQTKTKNKKDT